MKTKSLLVVVLTTLFTTAVFAQNHQGHSLNWKKTQFFNSKYAPNSGFGDAVFIDGDIAVTGDFEYNSVNIFKLLPDGTWQFTQELKGANNSMFGESVYILNDQLFVGCLKDKYLNVIWGSVFIYNLDRSTGTANYIQKITGNHPYSWGDCFGTSIAGESNTLVVGASEECNVTLQPVGAAYIFTKNNGLWTKRKQITNPIPMYMDHFGENVGISGNAIAIASPYAKVLSYNSSGKVYSYTYNSTTNSLTTGQTLNAQNPDKSYRYGQYLKFKNSTLLISGTDDLGGSVYCYTRNQSVGLTFSLIQRIDDYIPNFNGSSFGIGFDFNDNLLIIGDSYNNNYTGTVKLFKKSSNNWIKIQTELPDCYPLSTNLFGSCISLSGDYFLVGAPKQDSWLKSQNKFDINLYSSTNALILFFHQEPGLTADAGPDHASCTIDTITLGGNPTASHGNPPYSYYWTDGNTWSSTLPNPIVIPTQSTTYYLRVTDCNGNGNVIYDTVNVSAGEIPLPYTLNATVDAMCTDKNGNIAFGGRVLNDTLFINDEFFIVPGTVYFKAKYIANLNDHGCINYVYTFTCPSEDGFETSNIDIEFDNNNNLVVLLNDVYGNLHTSIPGHAVYYNNWCNWLAKFDPVGNLTFASVLDSLGYAYSNPSMCIDENNKIYLSTVNKRNTQPHSKIISFDQNGIESWRKISNYHSLKSFDFNSGSIIVFGQTNSNPNIYIEMYDKFNGTIIKNYVIQYPFSSNYAYLVEIKQQAADQFYFIYNIPQSSIYSDSIIIKKLSYSAALDAFNFANQEFRLNTNGYNINPIFDLPFTFSGSEIYSSLDCAPNEYTFPDARDGLYELDFNLNLSNVESLDHITQIHYSNNNGFLYYSSYDYDNPNFWYYDIYSTINKFPISKKSSIIENNKEISTRNDSFVSSNIECSIYPTLSKDNITIDFLQTLNSDCTLRIISVEGKLYQTHTIKSGNQQFVINITDLSPGVYLIKLNSSYLFETKKFIKQ